MEQTRKSEDLYQKVLLENARNPIGFGQPKEYSHKARGVNRLCGDTITIYLKVSDNRIQEAFFDGESCAIVKGTASLIMTELSNKTTDEARNLISQFEEFTQTWDGANFESFEALKAIEKFPTRLKCLKLPWETLKAAVQGSEQTVTTE